MKRLILAAILLAGGCKPVPPPAPASFKVNIASNNVSAGWNVTTSKGKAQLNADIAECSRDVIKTGLDGIGACLKERGYTVTADQAQ
jgi:hypothetical protein